MEVDPETHDSNHQDPHSADMAEGRGVDTDATNGAAADVTDLEECVDTEGGVEDTDMVSVDEESNNEEFDVLGCQQCKFPISHATDILMEKAEAIGPTVYHYDLDLDMVNTEIPCYSSDNPSGMRFDVVRTKPHEYITTHGPECPEHSFFPGYAWTSISCGRCSKHLGWGFTPIPTEATAATLAAAVALLVSVAGGEEWTGTMEATEATFDYTKSFSFFGVILTKLSPLKFTNSTFLEERERMHEDVVDFNPTVMLTDVMRMVRQLHSATYPGRSAAQAAEGTLLDQILAEADEADEAREREDGQEEGGQEDDDQSPDMDDGVISLGSNGSA